MPRLTDNMDNFNMGGGFQFSATKVDHLGATSYTLATLMVDTSGSVSGFEDLLLSMMKLVVIGCKKSPHSENIMLRACCFSTSYPDNGIKEIHGFKPVETIDPDDYEAISPSGSTPLYDAFYSGIASTLAYAKVLHDNGYTSNAINFTITDGANNASVATTAMIADELKRIRVAEQLDSILTILIRINVSNAYIKQRLEEFAQEVGIDGIRDAEQATAQNIAKLAGFVSQSVSSTAQAQGTGGPSQNIAPVI